MEASAASFDEKARTAAGHMSRRRNVLIGAGIVVVLFVWLGSRSSDEKYQGAGGYVDTYPLTQNLPDGEYRVGVISDMDKKSKVEGKNVWRAILQVGTLKRGADGTYKIKFDEKHDVTSELAVGGRGMELSCLVVFNSALYSCDDRSGVVYKLDRQEDKAGDSYTAIPQLILQEGDGKVPKSLKCEWMSVKDGELYVGGFGKEFVNGDDGSITSEGPMWVKIISTNGMVRHVDWRPNYRALRKATKKEHPSYLLHESAHWHAERQRWFFLPRRVSEDAYDEKKDELKGSNMILSVPDSFKVNDIVVTTVGEVVAARGFSAFRFIPDRPDEIVALRSVEVGSKTETYMVVFNVATGKILMPDELISGDLKFEGVEFI